MIKHRYEVTGVDSRGKQFYGACIAYDIVSAIQLFRDNRFSPHTVQSRKQVNSNEEIKIVDIQEYKYDRYSVYKSVMNHLTGAIDKIHTLEEAKDIISMITGNVYLNGEVYQMEQELAREFFSGNKETVEGLVKKFTSQRENNIEPDEDINGKHHCKLCGAYIEEDNSRVCDKCASDKI